MRDVHQSISLSNSRRKGAYFYVAVIVIVIAGVVISIEALRRLGAQPTTENPHAPSESAINGTGAPFPRQLRDGRGQLVTINARPQRIVSHTLGTDEILLAVCSPDRIVALSKFALDPKYSNVVEEARSVGSPVLESTEEILRLKPDLIFVTSFNRAEIIEQLQTTGARVFRVTNFDRIKDIKQNIRVIGQATGDEERAEALVTQMEHELDAVRARVAASSSNRRPRVMSYSPAGNTAGANTLFDEILRTIGAINVTAENGLEGYRKISAEQVALWQPDFIIVGADANKFEETKSQLLANPAVASTESARAGRIIVIDNRSFLTVSHHIVDLVNALAEGLYVNPPGKTK